MLAALSFHEVFAAAVDDLSLAGFDPFEILLVDVATGDHATRAIGSGFVTGPSGIAGGTVTGVEIRTADELFATLSGISEDAGDLFTALDAFTDADPSAVFALLNKYSYIFHASTAPGLVIGDFYTFANPVELIGGAGGVRFWGGEAADTLTGGAFADVMTGGPSGDPIDFGAGDGAVDTSRGLLAEHDGDDLVIGSALLGGETARISLTGFDRTGLAVEVTNEIGEGYEISFAPVAGQAAVRLGVDGAYGFLDDIFIASEVLADATATGGGDSLTLTGLSSGAGDDPQVLIFTGENLSYGGPGLQVAITGFSVNGGLAIVGLNEIGAAVEAALRAAEVYDADALLDILAQYRLTVDGTAVDQCYNIGAWPFVKDGMASGATIIGGASGGGLYGATSDDIIYAPGGSGTLEAAYGRDVIFLDPLDVAQSRLVYSGVGEVDGDVVFVFGPKDSIQLHSYDYFSSYTPSALSFAYGVLSVDLDEDGVVDARIAFPDLPDETLWLGI